MAEKNNGPNWDAIRQEYIETDISMGNLARKYKIKEATVKTRARRENWTDQRKKAESKANLKRIQKAAKARVGFIDRLDDVADLYIARLGQLAAEVESIYAIEKAIAALERLYRIKGLDAASQLAAKKQQGGGADDTDTFNENILSIAELINHPMPDRTMEQVEAPDPEDAPKDGDGA